MDKASRNRQRIQKLTLLMQGKATMLIVMQDHPDPDAIASAAALRQLGNTFAGVACTLARGSNAVRAENQALIKYLGLNFRLLANVDISRFDLIAMVDTQPGTGNNPLPADVVPDIVFDHHPIRRTTRRCKFTDVRSKYGATSSILFEYLSQAEIKPETPLATALLYGIRSDTQDLGRETTQADIDAYLALYPLGNKRMLSRIEHATVPLAYFQVLANALANALVIGKGIFSNVGNVDNPDMLGEVADLLLRGEDCAWSLCCGIHQEQILLSLRTVDLTAKAGVVMHRLVGRSGTGGGHSTLAGGQIPLKKGTEAEGNHIMRMIQKRFIAFLKAKDAEPERLVQRKRRPGIEP